MLKQIIVIFISAILLCSCTAVDTTSDEERPVYVFEDGTKKEAVDSGSKKNESEEEFVYEIVEEIFLDSFKGVGEQITETDSFPVNYNINLSSIVCSDEKGTLYYIDYGPNNSNYIHSLYEGNDQVLVEKICNFINYQDGYLYYLVSNKLPERYPFSWGGFLYSYDLSTGEEKCLLERNVYNLIVRGDTFFFQNEVVIVGDEWFGNEWMTMSMSEKEPSAMGNMLPFFYGKYQLAYEEAGKNASRLLLVFEEEKIPVTAPRWYCIERMTISGEFLWISISQNYEYSSVVKINLKDGSHKLYSTKTAEAYDELLQMSTHETTKFVLLQNELYVVSNYRIFCIDENKEQFEYKGHPKNHFDSIYSDGKELYATLYDAQMISNNTKLKLVKIDGDNGDFSEVR